MLDPLETSEKVWIFQANPQRFSIPAMLDDMAAGRYAPSDGDWAVTRYAGDIEPGDRMLLWEAGPEAGVLALCTITSDVYTYQDTGEFGDTGVDFEVTHLVQPRLLRKDLLDHPVLKDLQVIRVPNATNFRVTTEQWVALRDLIHAKPLEPSSVGESDGDEWDDDLDDDWDDDDWDVEEPTVGDALDDVQEFGASEARRPTRGRAAGRRADAAARRAVELRAMQVVTRLMVEHGYEVQDVSARRSFDLLATRGRHVLEVEVKGTTGLGNAVQLTRNEVVRAEERGEAALAIVSGIRLDVAGDEPATTGGDVRWFHPWTPARNDLTPVGYTYRVPQVSDDVASIGTWFGDAA